MTCFWDSITSSLVDEEYRTLGIPRNREKLIQTLKNKNTLVNTLWQGKELTNKEKEEHFQAIEIYNINGIHNGHLTSVCDSFLLLISQILNVNIRHNYRGSIIHYTFRGAPRRTLRFKSNTGHFWRD